MNIKEYEKKLEIQIKQLEYQLSLTNKNEFNNYDIQYKISDLKHELWQSRL